MGLCGPTLETFTLFQIQQILQLLHRCYRYCTATTDFITCDRAFFFSVGVFFSLPSARKRASDYRLQILQLANLLQLPLYHVSLTRAMWQHKCALIRLQYVSSYMTYLPQRATAGRVRNRFQNDSERGRSAWFLRTELFWSNF